MTSLLRRLVGAPAVRHAPPAVRHAPPAVRHAPRAVRHTAPFSASARTARPITSMEDMDTLISTLDTAGDQHPTKPPAAARAQDASHEFRPATLRRWKPFIENNYTRPHMFRHAQRYPLTGAAPRRTRLRVAPTTREARAHDPFVQLGVSPLALAEDPALLGAFVSEMGKIYPRTVTGLTPRSQRQLGRAIRRAKMLGIVPLHSAPRDEERRRSRTMHDLL